MSFFNSHHKLFGVATLMFVVLTLFVAILPALNNQAAVRPLPDAQPLSAQAARGKAVFVSNGCVACHSQQVRNVDMDRVWGNRPSIAADYAGNTRMDFWRNTATLMGTERTGPDLTDVGTRQPGREWNLVHLFNPRIVVKESVMPAYPFLFRYTEAPAAEDVVVSVPPAHMQGRNGKIVATAEALDLVAYLQSLKQAKLPEAENIPAFLYKTEKKAGISAGREDTPAADGEALYMANCSACHQANGEGLAGAFPPLKGSRIVTGGDLRLYVDIIMNGYDARPEYAAMTAVGTNQGWTEHEVAAIINYERSSWGNDAPAVSVEEIKELLDSIQQRSE